MNYSVLNKASRIPKDLFNEDESFFLIYLQSVFIEVSTQYYHAYIHTHTN